MDINVICPIALWSGGHKGDNVLALGFLCTLIRGEVMLDKDHSSFKWYSLLDLRNRFSTNRDIFGSLVDYERVFLLASVVRTRLL